MVFQPAMRKFNVPILRVLYPFFIGGAVVFYGVNKLQGTLMNSPAYINDPRHPDAATRKAHNAPH
ncbi:ATPase, F0 complex, subunit J [Thamnocephalis sphaerospora]|uniref:ATPase, F0 complex, subunit J n=1 Tax=Thamnocephalis sphaerospora TaxID=78915 RepID=A0A4P9XP42_9FUNG|nr:ATPase, F0 complex, subunit J [Thamnocephalis sphaerospora]|eukprot:RKP07736.1 ATPase, F0 complex, subunit J [Thamnocephalis sphaerospora]